MKRNRITAALTGILLLLSAMAMAAGSVDLKMKTEKEVTTVAKDGKKTTKLISAKKFAPGDTVIYTISYSNSTNEAVTNAIINDPIPAGTSFIPDSATGEGTEITYSIDKGKSYKKATSLVYQVDAGNGKKEQRVASPEQYTNIRWTIGSLPAKGSGKVSFKVRVK